jgi:hypothetical protein
VRMSDETEVEPVLSADEWASHGVVREVEGDSGGVARMEVSISPLDPHAIRVYDGTADAVDIPPTALAATIALSNDALPDGHPQKITHAVVQTVREAAHAIRAEYGSDDEQARAVDAVADALASLLPPP